MLASVACKVAVMAVDHGQACSDVAREVEGGHPLPAPPRPPPAAPPVLGACGHEGADRVCSPTLSTTGRSRSPNAAKELLAHDGPLEPGEPLPVPATLPGAGPRLLVGREQELTAVERFLDASADRRAALLVEGPPGIGKTTILPGPQRRALRVALLVEERRGGGSGASSIPHGTRVRGATARRSPSPELTSHTSTVNPLHQHAPRSEPSNLQPKPTVTRTENMTERRSTAMLLARPRR